MNQTNRSGSSSVDVNPVEDTMHAEATNTHDTMAIEIPHGRLAAIALDSDTLPAHAGWQSSSAE
ncbi:MAG: hypothetical protein HS111_37575 [Kofleriaceae bacterium]|nr:hypothetical protein [Kofleriaceae bacterium]MCL4223609.1 hypothetical protein [Myxococcales bacterium]